MLIEYALGTAWHDRIICEKIMEMQNSYLLLMHCGNSGCRSWIRRQNRDSLWRGS